MSFELDFILKNDHGCFKRYVTYYSYLIHDKIRKTELGDALEILPLGLFITYQKLAVLDKQFWSLLTDTEERYCREISRKSYSERTEAEKYLFDRCYQKWSEVFFSTPFEDLFYKLNPVSIGIVMKSIRFDNEVSQTSLARVLGVNRKTVMLIEGGVRFPSLEYIYRFSKLFEVAIDDIVSV